MSDGILAKMLGGGTGKTGALARSLTDKQWFGQYNPADTTQTLIDEGKRMASMPGQILHQGHQPTVGDTTDFTLDMLIGGGAFSTPPGAMGMNATRRAAQTALPMDEASRMARAREMGFDTSRPVYHGTATDFRAFDPDRSIGTQYWSTTDKAAVEAGNVGAQGRGVIKEMYHKIKNPAGWKEYDKYGIDELIALGYDGLALPEVDGQITYVAFKPNQYRDVRAKFDPAKANSANLLAMNAGPSAAALALAAQMREQKKQPPGKPFGSGKWDGT